MKYRHIQLTAYTQVSDPPVPMVNELTNVDGTETPNGIELDGGRIIPWSRIAIAKRAEQTQPTKQPGPPAKKGGR